jgi:hypothetical protein
LSIIDWFSKIDWILKGKFGNLRKMQGDIAIAGNSTSDIAVSIDKKSLRD